MSKMTPEIRFKGFDEVWKPCTINDVLTIGNGRDYKHLDSGDIPVFGSGGLMTTVNDFLYDGESVFIGRKGTIDKPSYYKGKFWTVDTLFYTHSFKNVLPLYVYSIFQRIDWQNYNAATGVPSLSKSTIQSIPIVISKSTKEQSEIGNYFKKIDDILSSLEREITRLEKMKLASLQKMFPRPGETVPEIRFEGFNEPWKELPLNKLVERITRKNGTQSQRALTISSLLGLVDQELYFNHRVASRDVSNYILIRNGEFAYNKSYSEGFPWGSVKRLNDYDMGVLSTLYIVFGIIYDSINSDYLSVYFETNLWHEYLSQTAEEGARNHGLLNISADDFLSLPMLVPSSIDEQSKIGDYFNNLCNIINAKRQKLEKLRNIKKACLEKMFVNNTTEQ